MKTPTIPKALKAVLKKAPRFAGWRLLKPTEPARHGDRFGYLSVVGCLSIVGQIYGEAAVECCPEVDDTGCFRLGRSLLGSYRAFTKYRGPGFDGVLYRKLKK